MKLSKSRATAALPVGNEKPQRMGLLIAGGAQTQHEPYVKNKTIPHGLQLSSLRGEAKHPRATTGEVCTTTDFQLLRSRWLIAK